MNIRDWASVVPELRGEDIQMAPLRGGVTNQSFLVTGDFGRWVLRVNVDARGVDRQRERMVLDTIADARWAPEVIRNGINDGYLLYVYRNEPVWTRDHARSSSGQRLMGTWLADLHGRPATTVPRIEPIAALNGYLYELPAERRHELAEPVQEVCEAWAEEAGSWSEALCHLDLVATNVIGNVGVHGVIDWEFSGRAEPALDLALYLHYNDLDAET
ncbi:MAG: phosphotransferase, partial [Pseudomonadota bacterium]